MKQYGDITKLNGYDLDPVDLIVGGSPCQDLSVAGLRKGLDGERSGLFLEMIRIIKEMREKTNGVYPRFALWENVPGAFSSNDGKDFGSVLGEFARIIEPNAPDVPVPKEGWANSGVLLVGGGGSIAYRTHDAQFWGKTIRDSRTGDVLQMGTPQRRRRIALIADFRGQSAPEILFERKSLSGNFEQSQAQMEDPTGTAENSIRSASGFNGWQSITSSMPILREKTPPIEATMPPNALIVLNDQGGSQMDISESTTMTLRHQSHGHEPVILEEERERERESAISFQERSGKPGGGKGILIQEDHVGALSTMNNQMVYDPSVHHGYKEFDDVSETVRSRYGTGGNNQPLVVATMQGFGEYAESDTASACKQRDWKDATDLVCRIHEAAMYSERHYQEQNSAGCSQASRTGDECYLVSENPQLIDLQDRCHYVRRLTPLECTRLQGYPDKWLDIPGASDSQKYRALGNSICLPFWEFLAHRFAEIGNVQSIGSLFDGIGGFPLVFKRAGAKTLWTSEIEPFCEKVVKYHVDHGDL